MRYTDCKEENWELTLEKCLGEKRKACNKRNGINERSPGDKCYKAPECSSHFHRKSTMSTVKFGEIIKPPDTFIPLLKSPLKPRGTVAKFQR
ncbi:spermatogenesis-associated serine-rich protein 1-like isoform X2 [Xenia sp. Carnegie-2017]|uniref:spermatogenesis-associated serine-rich protein 1-like isoform X2 n=1 Tax=Xenia sp. Carnegie-2017 TaxID=2897299 RepID=UPI001F037211|nr:spermatogenesis-associated serine-rich protein 1-like isoform X2 [Xenia sp. Carnegie-2017]